jgi:hypothetical protein
MVKFPVVWQSSKSVTICGWSLVGNLAKEPANLVGNPADNPADILVEFRR